MAYRGNALKGSAPGIAIVCIVVALILGSLFALIAEGGKIEPSSLSNTQYVWHALGFTLLQASSSTFLSLGVGLLVARALAHRGNFWSRNFIQSLFSVPIVCPSLIAIFGIVAIYGNNGVLVSILRHFESEITWNLYGLGGILIAHVFFNMPMALRLLLPAWDAIPRESLRLADQLGIQGFSFFTLIEWPILRRYIPRASALVFSACVTSFAIILTLGGGPRAATIEVVIFETLRYEANPAGAARLALLSLCLTIPAYIFAEFGSKSLPLGMGLSSRFLPSRQIQQQGYFWDALWIFLALLLVVPPLLATLMDGIRGFVVSDLSLPSLAQSFAISLAIALPAGLFSALAAFNIAATETKMRRHWRKIGSLIGFAGALPLCLSPIVLALGLFILFSSIGEGKMRTLMGIILTNALLTVPFLIGLLRPVLERKAERHDLLCFALGLEGWERWRIIDWPIMRGAIGQAVALGTVFSLGDLAAVSLYGDPDIRTLPLLIYDQLSAYRIDEAAVTAFTLLGTIFVMYRTLERIIGGAL